MSQVALITGASSGIGRAVAVNLVKRGIQVIAVGRRLESLRALQAQLETEAGNLTIIGADVSSESGQQAIVEAVEAAGSLHYLLHNAATIEPSGTLCQVEIAEWRRLMAVNVEAPLALTQRCLPSLVEQSRILHISSGAAMFPIQTMAAYCMSKAALFMQYQLLRDELAPQQIWVGSVRPGIVNTAMTDVIAWQSEQVDDNVRWFRDMKESNEMLPVETVAAFLEWLLCDVSAEEFIRSEWDIYQSEHHIHWLGDLAMPVPAAFAADPKFDALGRN